MEKKITKEQNNLVYDKINTISAPKTLHLTITNSCNWDCVFCSVHSKKLDYYPTKTIKKVLDKIANSGVVSVNLYGGEPTLHPDFLDIGKYARDLGLAVGFLSNGAKINEKNVATITDIFEAGTISIHGFKKTHERITKNKASYYNTINAISLLSDYGFNLGIATTVSTLNFFEFPKFIKYLYYNYPATNLFIINRASFTGDGQKYCLNPGEILDLVKRIDILNREYNIPIRLGVPTPPELLTKDLRKYASFCSAGTDFGNILGNGDIKMCFSLAGSPSFGNILKTPLSELWNADYLLKYRSFDWVDKKCKICRFFYDCFCGCKRQLGGGYGVDKIIYEKSNDFFVLDKYTKKRLINGITAYSNLYSPTILINDLNTCNLVDSLITPLTKLEIMCLAKKYGVNINEVDDLIDKLLDSRILKKVFRKDISCYDF